MWCKKSSYYFIRPSPHGSAPLYVMWLLPTALKLWRYTIQYLQTIVWLQTTNKATVTLGKATRKKVKETIKETRKQENVCQSVCCVHMVPASVLLSSCSAEAFTGYRKSAGETFHSTYSQSPPCLTMLLLHIPTAHEYEICLLHHDCWFQSQPAMQKAQIYVQKRQ